MSTIGIMTPGTLLFLVGIMVLGVALTGSLMTAVTSKRRKQKLQERMRVKYGETAV